MTSHRLPLRAARASILLLSLLAACAEVPPEAPPAPPPAPAPAPVIEAPPAPPATLEIIVPVETKVAEPPKPHAVTKPAHAAPTAPTKPAEPAAQARKPTQTPPPTRRRSATPALRIPVWMAGCAQRVQHAGAIQCDADALLVEPSDKVQVYTRDASKVHALPDGNAVILREGLPHLYRFFVLP